MKQAIFLTAFVFAASCAVDLELETAKQHPIVNGRPTDNFREVVQVVGAQTGEGACTGTLIGSQTVLTAAHCICGGATATVWGLEHECNPGGCNWIPYSVTGDVVVHPNYNPCPGGLNDDFALVRLSRPIMGVTPASIATTMHLGLPVTLVGYGLNTLQPGGTYAKREGQNTISNLDSTFLYFPSTSGSGICYGDSGGPAYGGELCTVGVAKGQDPPTCTAGAPYRESRVDIAAGWIQANASQQIQTCLPPVRTDETAVAWFYLGLLNRAPDAGGYSFWLNQLRMVRCNNPNNLHSSLDSIISAFIYSAEFQGQHLSNQAYVRALYKGVLRRDPDPAGLAYWTSQLDSGARTREDVRVIFVYSAEFYNGTVAPIMWESCISI